MIDPYQLLGLTIESTPADARAAFRDLALLVHPDKGGQSADMKVLLDAYRYVLAQLSAVNRTTTVEDMEATFAAFCESQREEDDLRPPWVRELLREGSAFDADRFNDAFHAFDGAVWTDDGVSAANDVGGAADGTEADGSPSAGAGYGPLMVASEYAAVDGIVSPIVYTPTVAAVVAAAVESANAESDAYAFRRTVILYTQPRPCNDANLPRGHALHGSDYLDAFNTTPEPLADPPIEEPLEQLLLRLQASRDALPMPEPPWLRV
jgi:hypothetical protein